MYELIRLKRYCLHIIIRLMNLDQARLNFDLLLNLPENTRLYAKDSVLSYDNRWVSGVRRWRDSSSRFDILDPINHTIITIACTKSKSTIDILNCLATLRIRFKVLYPDFSDLFDLLTNLDIFVRQLECNNHGAECSDGSDPTPVVPDCANDGTTVTKEIEEINITCELPNDEHMYDDMPELEEISEYTCDCGVSHANKERIDISESDDDSDEQTAWKELNEAVKSLQKQWDDGCVSEQQEQAINMEFVPLVSDAPKLDIEDIVAQTFESQVRNFIVPILEQETEEILNSLNREVEQLKHDISSIRRRFVSPFVTNSGEVIGNSSSPRVPSIPNFFLVDISDSDDDDSDHELLDNTDRFGCVKNIVNQIGQDMNTLSDAAFEVYKGIHKMINKLL